MKQILIVIFAVLLFVVFFAWQIFAPIASDDSEVIFMIEKGQGSREIAVNLQYQGFIWWNPIFRAYVLLTGSSGNLQAGTYVLAKNMTIPQITQKFTSGEVSNGRITIIEGWNLRNLGFYFENKGIFQAEEIWEIAGFPAVDYTKATDLPLPKDFSDDYVFLASKPANVGLEGFLFPDTYEIHQDANTEEIIRKMLDNFDEKLTPALREEIARQDKTIFQIVTMASILEREAQTKEDRGIVSGIFWKRIKLGMPLESCATIAYVKGVDQWRYSFEDTRIESPYNTYLNYGLPRGPISNPSMDSILAAIYPQSSEYLFYLSTPEGESIFSRTLEEHNIAKAKYLK